MYTVARLRTFLNKFLVKSLKVLELLLPWKILKCTSPTYSLIAPITVMDFPLELGSVSTVSLLTQALLGVCHKLKVLSST